MNAFHLDVFNLYTLCVFLQPVRRSHVACRWRLVYDAAGMIRLLDKVLP